MSKTTKVAVAFILSYIIDSILLPWKSSMCPECQKKMQSAIDRIKESND